MVLVQGEKIFPETRFAEWLDLKDRSEKTKKEYLYYLRKLGDFNQTNVDALLSRFKNRVCRAAIKNYRKFLLRNRVETNLTPDQIVLIQDVDVPEVSNKAKRKKPEVITKEEVELILDAFDRESHKIMLLLTYRCALRISELFSISKRSFYFEAWKKDMSKNGILKVKGKGGKIDTILVKPHIMLRVLRFINTSYKPETFDPSAPLFSFISPARWRTILSRASKKAIGRHINPHLLRHSYATYLLEQGWDIKRIQVFLRHEDISSTQVYVQVSKKQLSEDYQNID